MLWPYWASVVWIDSTARNLQEYARLRRVLYQWRDPSDAWVTEARGTPRYNKSYFRWFIRRRKFRWIWWQIWWQRERRWWLDDDENLPLATMADSFYTLYKSGNINRNIQINFYYFIKNNVNSNSKILAFLLRNPNRGHNVQNIKAKFRTVKVEISS